MTITKPACPDVTSITITSANDLDTATTVKLEYMTCCDSAYQELSVTFADDAVTLTPSDLGQTGANFADNVYCFRLTATYSDQTTVEYGQTFIDCEIACQLDYTDSDITEVLYYLGIKNMEHCDDCGCIRACELYKALLNLLNDDCDC